MKKSIIFGILSPIVFYASVFLLIVADRSLSEKSYNFLVIALLAPHGIALAILLASDTFGEFFGSLGLCFSVSLIIILLFNIANINPMIYYKITCGKEVTDRDELIFLGAMFYLVAFCFAGTAVAAAVTFFRKRREKKRRENGDPGQKNV